MIFFSPEARAPPASVDIIFLRGNSVFSAKAQGEGLRWDGKSWRESPSPCGANAVHSSISGLSEISMRPRERAFSKSFLDGIRRDGDAMWCQQLGQTLATLTHTYTHSTAQRWANVHTELRNYTDRNAEQLDDENAMHCLTRITPSSREQQSHRLQHQLYESKILRLEFDTDKSQSNVHLQRRTSRVGTSRVQSVRF